MLVKYAQIVDLPSRIAAQDSLPTHEFSSTRHEWNANHTVCA